MRLLSITVRNYRIHQEVKVEFDRSRTLIGGPNESGKSTLVEAAHRVLFLKAKTGGKVLQGMKSTLHTDPPKVTLCFEAQGQTWEVEKRFSGSSGQARLNRVGGQSWQGDEAETKLAELLGTSGSVNKEKELSLLWPHLWVWQGRSGEDPSDHATEHRDALVQRLQSEGLAAVMQSDFDQRVKDRIAEAYEALFTATGKPKAGSKPEVARLQLEEAEAALVTAQEAATRLEDAVRAHGSAESILKQVDAVLPGLQKELKLTKEKLLRVTELQALEKDQNRVLKEAGDNLERLRKESLQLHELQRQIEEISTKLQPLEQQLVELAAAVEEAHATRQQHEAKHQALTESLRTGRAKADLASALVAVFEKGELRDALVIRAEEVRKAEQEIQVLRQQLATLPKLAAADVAKLRTLEGEWHKAVVVRDATAAELKVLEAEAEVWVDGQPLLKGESKVLSDEVEVRIGEGTRLRLRPGGGTSLAAARTKAQEAEQRLQDELNRWSLGSVEKAVQLFDQAESLRQEGTRLLDRLNAFGGDQTAKELESARTACQTAEAEMQRRLNLLAMDASTLPATLSEARLWAQEMRDLVAKDDEAVILAKAGMEESRLRWERTEKLRQEQLERLTELRKLWDELRLRVRVVEEKYSSKAEREEVLAAAVGAHAQAREKLEVTQKLLAELQPDMLLRDEDRLNRSLVNKDQERRTAETQLAVARSQLVLDGKSNPEADLQQAQARVTEAREVYEMEQRRAKAVERLFNLFAESREAIDRRLVQPLADRVTGYLQCVFGPGSELHVLVTEEGRLEFEVSRAGGGAFGFESLSGGAKEQVAAAVRLAMAEILAAEHDGCLPLVFDDAFAYADPLRVQQMQRMLDLAATRGLQVVVLTCNPADYAGFGGAEARLG